MSCRFHREMKWKSGYLMCKSSSFNGAER
jgi:hypothetical protein